MVACLGTRARRTGRWGCRDDPRAWLIVAVAVGSLLGGPVLGLLLGALMGGAGFTGRVGLGVSLGVALLVVWVGQAVAFRGLWQRRVPGARVDRLLVVSGTLTVLCPFAWLLVVASGVR